MWSRNEWEIVFYLSSSNTERKQNQSALNVGYLILLLNLFILASVTVMRGFFFCLLITWSWFVPPALRYFNWTNWAFQNLIWSYKICSLVNAFIPSFSENEHFYCVGPSWNWTLQYLWQCDCDSMHWATSRWINTLLSKRPWIEQNSPIKMHHSTKNIITVQMYWITENFK